MNPISHDSPLFNIHDVVIVMSAAQYLLLAFLVLSTRRRGERSSLILVLMLLVNSAIAIDTIVIWSKPLREYVLYQHPNWMFFGSIGNWLQGPLLYWYVRAVLYSDQRFSLRDTFHLLPSFLFAAALIVQFHLLSDSDKAAAMINLKFMWTPLMKNSVTLWHLSIVVYSAYCLKIINTYRSALLQQFSNIEVSERNWLRWVVIGFMAIAGWKLFINLIGSFLPSGIPNLMGIASIYFTFIFVTSLVFVSTRYIDIFAGIRETDIEASEEVKPYSDDQIAQLTSYIDRQKPYLEHDIKLEGLAAALSLPERTLSKILNQHFGKNFFEFINHYRVDHAKDLLLHETEKNILDIMIESGFSSKSSFNTLFKKYAGLTPSEYRREHSTH